MYYVKIFISSFSFSGGFGVDVTGLTSGAFFNSGFLGVGGGIGFFSGGFSGSGGALDRFFRLEEKLLSSSVRLGSFDLKENGL